MDLAAGVPVGRRWHSCVSTALAGRHRDPGRYFWAATLPFRALIAFGTFSLSDQLTLPWTPPSQSINLATLLVGHLRACPIHGSSGAQGTQPPLGVQLTLQPSITIVWPLAASVLYFLISAFVVLFVLRERRPILFLVAAALLFALGEGKVFTTAAALGPDRRNTRCALRPVAQNMHRHVGQGGRRLCGDDTRDLGRGRPLRPVGQHHGGLLAAVRQRVGSRDTGRKYPLGKSSRQPDPGLRPVRLRFEHTHATCNNFASRPQYAKLMQILFEILASPRRPGCHRLFTTALDMYMTADQPFRIIASRPGPVPIQRTGMLVSSSILRT